MSTTRRKFLLAGGLGAAGTFGWARPAAARDLTPTEQSIELFKRAGQPAELHLISDGDHFMFGEGNRRVRGLLRGWLAQYFPAAVAAEKRAAATHA